MALGLSLAPGMQPESGRAWPLGLEAEDTETRAIP